MRYQVLRALEPFDPRHRQLVTLDELVELCDAFSPCDLEMEAVAAVRNIVPDGPAMPLPLGPAWLLGFVQDHTIQYQPTDVIPFVVFVRAIPEREKDRALIARRAAFDRSKWKMPVHRPAGTAAAYGAELRATDLEDAVHTDVAVGRLSDGRLVITADIGGIAMSIAFHDKDLDLIEASGFVPSEAPRTVVVSASVGSSYDPNPR